MLMKPTLIYCYDAYCSWCYAFGAVMTKIAEEYRSLISLEVLSGGMILPASPTPIRVTAGFIQQEYKAVEERTGIQFGSDYLWHINNPDKSDWFPDSSKSAIALCILKEYLPEDQIQLASALQYSLQYEGRDLTDDEAYRHLLEKYAIPANEFYKKLKSSRYRKQAMDEFDLVKQLKVSGFPTVLVQTSDTRFYLVARGYVDYADLKIAIEQVLAGKPGT